MLEQDLAIHSSMIDYNIEKIFERKLIFIFEQHINESSL